MKRQTKKNIVMQLYKLKVSSNFDKYPQFQRPEEDFASVTNPIFCFQLPHSAPATPAAECYWFS